MNKFDTGKVNSQTTREVGTEPTITLNNRTRFHYTIARHPAILVCKFFVQNSPEYRIILSKLQKISGHLPGPIMGGATPLCTIPQVAFGRPIYTRAPSTPQLKMANCKGTQKLSHHFRWWQPIVCITIQYMMRLQPIFWGHWACRISSKDKKRHYDQ